MPKPKSFHKQGKNKKTKDELALDTVDDYQAAGVEYEEAAGKHRAGDASKSLRFFDRAIKIYDEGLTRFPKSFDLAYNKARAQYEVATHPKLAEQLQQPVIDILRVALASHEYALKLDENDPDLLFNTAQVLTSVAEQVANSGSSEEAIRLLQSALGMQDRCFPIQEERYAESLRQQEKARKLLESSPKNDVSHDKVESEQSSEEFYPKGEGEWASVVEPVTVSTLVDTILAVFATMTTMCTTITSSGDQSWTKFLTDLEDQGNQLLTKIQSLSVADIAIAQELALTVAIFKSALLDAAFTFDSISAGSYKERIDSVWSAPSINLLTAADTLVAHANALIAFNFSLSNKATQGSSEINATCRWTVLTAAMKSLTIASKLPSMKKKAEVHLLRGDVSMLQYRLSTPPIYKQAVANAEMLLKNAEVFYHNAAQLSKEQDEKENTLFRSCIAQQLAQTKTADNGTALEELLQADQTGRAREELQEMLDEGLLIEIMDPSGVTVYI